MIDESIIEQIFPKVPIWLIAIVIIWSLTWKALALWKAARKNSPVWFIILLVVNTLGVLEALYIFLFSEIKLDEVKQEKPRSSTRSRRGSK